MCRLETDVSHIHEKLIEIEDILRMIGRTRISVAPDKMPAGLTHLRVPKAEDHPLLYYNSPKSIAIVEATKLAPWTTAKKAANVTLGFPDAFHEELMLPGVPFALATPPAIVIDKAVVSRSTPT
jgi:hypothetical protein